MAEATLKTSERPTLGLEVLTEAGVIRGSGDAIKSFKGVPFAAPPVGPLRWQPPQPPVAWEGVRDALEFGYDCPQPSARGGGRSPGQSEDCLTLNIWTPAQHTDEKLPVVVWVYGGGFLNGSSAALQTDGETYAKKGVVYVTTNYRTGIFGWLAHPQLTAEQPQGFSGNWGVLDQFASLRWIRDNIAAFGGDPERVTLQGVSAGSALISLCMVSPLAEGLFQQAILESPGAFRPLASLAEAEAYGLKLGDDIEAARQISVEELLEKQKMFIPEMRGLTTPRILRPIRDGYVIPNDDRDAYGHGAFLSIPTLIGTQADEGTSLTRAWPINTAADAEKTLLENFDGAEEEARSLYPIEGDAGARWAVAQMFADTQFQYGAFGIARAMAAKGQKVYRYVFTRRRPDMTDGPHHGGEVNYVFGLDNVPESEAALYDDTDRTVAKAMQDAWVRFAATADPNGAGIPAWPVYDTEADESMEFGDEIKLNRGWRRTHVDFLDRYYGDLKPLA